MDIEFTGEIFCWRGPSPYFFVAVPDEDSQQVKALAGLASYGWGVIPVDVTIGATAFYTALFPKDGRYLVPLKDAVRRAEQLAEGATVTVRFVVRH